VRILALIGIGGAFGALGRFGLDHAFNFTPLATLAVNVIGCLLIGMVMAVADRRPIWWRPLLVTGFLGGFTTFSAFAADAVLVLLDQQTLLALGYIAITLVAGIGAVMLGERIVR
jgi:CrcB protein